MRILFVTAPPLDRALGGAKPFMELADEFARLGWEVELMSLGAQVPGSPSRQRGARAEHLRTVLGSHAGDFDVVDFDHEYLPYPRSGFAANTLLVARSVLLCHQVATTTFPRPWTARRMVGSLLYGRRRKSNLDEMLSFAARSVDQADLVNVSNDDDADLLAASGVGRDKIVVFPFGLSGVRRAEFAAMRDERSDKNIVAFVGTFDWRKGAADMPAIIERVVREAPQTRFRLLGTKSMFPTAEDVLGCFPAQLRALIEVVPSFKPAELPALLEDCTLGFFPSYLEGFGFGVLEMLAASLPVFAYDAPGPRMILDREYLVPRGHALELAAGIVSVLRDPARLLRLRGDAARRAELFRWEEIAARTAEFYENRLVVIRGGATSDGPTRELRQRAASEIA